MVVKTKAGQTSVKMTKKNRLAILKAARKIISDPKRWTTGKLRRRIKGEYKYCLLGAVEQATYDLGLAEPGPKAFVERESQGLGYKLSGDLSLETYSFETRHASPYSVNDLTGREGALSLLDDYITEVQKGKAREPKGD